MSFDILYKKQFIKLSDNEIIPMIESGSNNVCTCDRKPKRARDWENHFFVTNYNVIVSPEDILKNIDEYRLLIIERNKESNAHYIAEGNPNWCDEYSDKRWGYFTSVAIYGRRTSTTTFGAYRSFYSNGIKEAMTIEELVKYSVWASISIPYYCEKPILEKGLLVKPSVTFTSTNHARETIKEWEEYYGKAGGFYINFNSTYGLDNVRSTRRRDRAAQRTAKPKTDYSTTDHYILHSEQYGYFVRKKKYGFSYSYSMGYYVKKFLKRKDAERYIKDNHLAKYKDDSGFVVEPVKINVPEFAQ